HKRDRMAMGFPSEFQWLRGLCPPLPNEWGQTRSVPIWRAKPVWPPPVVVALQTGRRDSGGALARPGETPGLPPAGTQLASYQQSPTPTPDFRRACPGGITTGKLPA